MRTAQPLSMRPTRAPSSSLFRLSTLSFRSQRLLQRAGIPAIVPLLTLTAGAAALALAPASGAQTIDGTVSSGEYNLTLATQTTPTGYGDNFSELDQALGRWLPDGSFQLALTGNLEGNGNGLVIFVDSRAGGGVVSRSPAGYGTLGSIAGKDFTHRASNWGIDTDATSAQTTPPQPGSVLPPGFNPEVALEVNNDGTNYFIDRVDMTQPNDPPATGIDDRSVFLADSVDPSHSGLVNSGIANATELKLQNDGVNYVSGGTLTHAFNNTNVNGVVGYDFGANGGPTLGDPTTATTGFEFLFSKEFLNADPGQEIRILPFISNAFGDFLSNQFLPGLPGEPNNFIPNLDNLGGIGGTPLFDAEHGFASPLDKFYIDVPLPEWQASGSGIWSNDANWAVIRPDAVNMTAKFGRRVTGDASVLVDGNHTIGGIIFDNPSASYTLASGAAPGTITFATLPGKNARINDENGNHKITAAMTVNSPLRLSVGNAGDTLTLDNNVTYAAGTGPIKDGAGTARVRNVLADSLTVNEGRLQIIAGRNTLHTSKVGAITIGGVTDGWTGTLDLTDNDAIVDYGSESPILTIQNQIKSGFNNGNWQGTGISSSSAQATAGTAHKTAVGFGESSVVLGAGGGSFSGQTADGSAVLLRYTYAGDANLDGKVDTLDFNSLAANFGGTGKVWTQADFNYDGAVDTLDFNNLAANFGQVLAAADSGAAGRALVPEPSSVALLLAGAALLQRKRRS